MDSTKNYTFEDIHAFCKDHEQQLRIVVIAKLISKQGLTQLFIKPQETKELAVELMRENVLPAGYNLAQFTDENMYQKMVEFLTKKIAYYIEYKGGVTDEESCNKIFNEVVVALAVPPKSANVLFSWMAEFAFSYKEELGKALNQHRRNLEEYDETLRTDRVSTHTINGFWYSSERQLERLNEMYDKALPCGMVRYAEHKQWIYNRDIESRRFDVSPLIEWMPFDRYFAVAFNNAPTYENRLKGHIREKQYLALEPSNFKSADALKIEIDNLFRVMVYEDMMNGYIDEEDFYEIDLAKHVIKWRKEKSMRVCFMYLAAMVRVSYIECQRLDRLLKTCG
jgi:hypothetical protein